MIDFKKRLASQEGTKKINPIEIYDNLDRSSVTGPLRPTQLQALNEWYNCRLKDKDLIIKLHTGEGKTLIGLLILYSRINQGEGPGLFVCPNNYLVEQVTNEAIKFGIPYCLIPENNEIPNDYINGKKVLIISVQKLFNGRSIFGIDNRYVSANTIILDDAHACIEAIKSAFTIRIPREHLLFNKLISIFEADLEQQGEGSFLDIKANRSSDDIMTVPYWAWIEKSSQITQLLSEFSDSSELFFSWPILKNEIMDCQMFITNNGIEIQPYQIPTNRFGTFTNAKQRILMSATTQEDSFFIKGLGFSLNAIQHPITNSSQKWSGEKMILIPSLIDESLDRSYIISKFATPRDLNFGIVILTPNKKMTQEYCPNGTIYGNEGIGNIIRNLKSKSNLTPVVFANRYDGIDLPDDSCRILILDSIPYWSSLCDRYEVQCRTMSDIVNMKITQKIEQGLGRSVRGEKDYSVIIITGANLVKFIKSSLTNKYFSPQTRKQIAIGLSITEMVKEDFGDDKDTNKVFISVINQALDRDEGWKEYYKTEMDTITEDSPRKNIYDILFSVREAEEQYKNGQLAKACDIIQTIIDKPSLDNSEKGWYLQILARYKYFESKVEYNKVQLSAFSLNKQLLKPVSGVNYKKIGKISDNRNKRIKSYIGKFNNFEDFNLFINDLVANLCFGTLAEKFETALYDTGLLLGFESQRPDKEIRKGPDNLWAGVGDQYFLFECKSEVSEGRNEISKHEAGQMNSHCGWFDSEYGSVTKVKRVLIIPTLALSYQANFTHNIEIIRKNGLKKLRDNIKAFANEFKQYELKDISEEFIQNALIANKLDMDNLLKDCTEKYIHQSK